MPTLMVLQGPDKGQRFRVRNDHDVILVGRASEATPLTDYTVSRRHAELKRSGRSWMLDDLRSANGTYLNEKRLERPTRLKDGDKIRMGATILVWDGSEGETRVSGATLSADLVDLDIGGAAGSSIIGTVGTGDDSMILASPAAAEAVRSWRVISALLDAVGAALTPKQLTQRVLDLVFEEAPADRGVILLLDEKSGKFETEAVRAVDEKEDRVRAGRNIIEHVVQKKEGVLCSNAMSDSRFNRPDDTSIKAIGLSSVICVPMIAHERVIGVLYVDCAMAKHIYTEEQLRLVAAIGQMAGVAIEDARLVNERMRTERLAAAGETVAALSHYIKNILQGLRGGSDVVEMGLRGGKTETIEQGWEIVRRNLDNIFALTMNMLAFAKQREPRRSPVQILSLLSDVLKLARPRADERGILLKTRLDDNIPAIHVDEHGIHQVALNIINNAIDAVPRSEGVVNVTLEFNEDENAVILTVGDNGEGIPEDLREKIFDAFYSTKGHGGTGLGLAVAKKIVDEHQGRITVKSVTGEGTLIRIVLPATPPGTSIDSAATHGPAV
ncbi:MAG TPA: ATP-binding protein [Phycisphaerae bacterium]|nr:ATP-binding protein [Phycisphaerae bacterium]HRW52672.1 ATP-binding protein [Phycisphaerae bacterium]